MSDMPSEISKCLTNVVKWLEANDRQVQADMLRHGVREVEIRCYPEGCIHTYAQSSVDFPYDSDLYVVDYPKGKAPES